MSHMNAQCQICNTPSKQSEGTITHEYAMSHMQHAQQAKWITNYTSRSIWSTQGHNCSSLPGIEQQFCWQKIGECLYSSLGPMKFAADSVLYCLYYSTWLRDSFSQNQCGLITIFLYQSNRGFGKTRMLFRSLLFVWFMAFVGQTWSFKGSEFAQNVPSSGVLPFLNFLQHQIE